jgi:hypothetical protein
VNAWIDRIQAWLRSRTQREQWLLIGAAVTVVVATAQPVLIQPLRADIERADQRIERLETELLHATRMAADMLRLQAELSVVEQRIEPGARTNLFTLLEALAAQAAIGEQLESIKPKQASGNERYPETRVEVTLKGTSLGQTVNFLYLIENADSHLIIRSIRIKTRGSQKLLDVSFSVSSFERA